MVKIVHTTDEYSGVGMIEVINEPVQGDGAVDSLRSSYYVDAYTVRSIRTPNCPSTYKTNVI